MPIQIRKHGDKWRVTDGHKIFGTHDTRAQAAAQVRAIDRKINAKVVYSTFLTLALQRDKKSRR